MKIGLGFRAPLIVQPTGTGKTTIGSEIARLHEKLEPSNRVLWLAHVGELVAQAEARLRSFGVNADVATVQSLVAKFSRGETLSHYSLLVVDEAHHYAADTYRQIIQHYSNAIIIGLTATPERGDGRALGDIFDCIVPGASIKQLTADGYLAPLEVIAPDRRLDPGELAMDPVDAYKKHAPGELALVFVPTVADARKIQADFDAAKIPAGIVHGQLPASVRGYVLEQHASGQIKILINVFLLGEGYDCPAISCVILARGASTISALIQMAGRPLRPFPGKSRALFIDLPGVTHVLGSPDEEFEYSLSGMGIRKKGEEERFCPVCAALLPLDHEGACGECGADIGGLERKPLRVVNVELSRFIANNRPDVPEKAAKLAGLIKFGFIKKYKPGWARAEFKRTVGFWPTKKMIDMANQIAREKA